jgi:hypothetical protein
MGVSTDLQASQPSFVLEFPIFRFQGGDHYMQGDSTEEDKTIEFGLDLAPLVNQLINGQPVQFFLQVEEKDPQGTSDGEITSYSLINYTSGSPVTTNCASYHVPIENNTITRLKILSSVNVQRPEITTPSLPQAWLLQPYNYQLTASGGSSPYIWDAVMDYPETISTETFPVIDGQKLELTENNTGYSIVTLPFDFPFYQKTVRKIFVNSRGYIGFDDQPLFWPYLIDKMLLFRYTSIISPFLNNLYLYPSQSDGIWYRADNNSATIRWKASVADMPGSSNVNFAVKLYKSGKIEFYYGTMDFPGWAAWIGGISGGDNQHWQLSQLNNTPVITTNTLDCFTSCNFPAGMKITEDGLFTGVPLSPCQNCPVTFRVTDNNNISAKKTILFSASGLMVVYSIHAGTDTIIEYGDSAFLDLLITNTGSQAVHNVSSLLTTTNSYLTLADSTEMIGDLGAGETRILNDSFKFKVSPVVPDHYVLPLFLKFSSNEYNYQQEVNLTVHSPRITIDELNLADGDNNRLDPGETTDLIVTFKNTGGAGSVNTKVVLTSLDPYLVVNEQEDSLGIMKPDSVKSAVFNITATGSTPFEHLYTIKNVFTADNGFIESDTGYLLSGDVIEDFETGDFNKFNWAHGGEGNFYIDSLEKHEGRFCTRSGWIYPGQSSVLLLNAKVLRNSKISFYMRVSCEHDPGGYCTFDYLAFYIDDKEMGRWDGSVFWTLKTFKVSEGYHTFRWIYQKDSYTNWGSDCAWIDFITFPPMNNATPVIGTNPSFLTREVESGKASENPLLITNVGSGMLDFSAVVYDTSAVPKASEGTENLVGSYISCLSDGFVPGQPFSWNFTLFNQGTDNEYIDRVRMDIPEGITITSVTSFSGGSLGDLVYQLPGSDSSTIIWQGVTPGGTGVIKPGETAHAVISGSSGKSFIDDVFVVYTIRSDSTGGDPQTVSGYIRVNNNSLPNTWLTLSRYEGNLSGYETDTVLVRMDAHGLSKGNYYCDIIVKDGFNNEMIIPVTMQVIDSNNNAIPNITGNLLIRGYPNPFRQFVFIEYEIKKTGHVQAWISDINGKKIRNLISATQQEGRYRLIWNGENESGDKVSPGIYYCSMLTDDNKGTLKLILIR